MPTEVEEEHRIGSGSVECIASALPKSKTCNLSRSSSTLSLKSSAKLMSCPMEACDMMFTKRFSLKEHLKETHNKTDYVPFVCPVVDCAKGFNTKAHLKRHARVHSGYMCDLCDETFQSWSLRRKHVAQAHPHKHDCPECGASFDRPYFLLRHQKLHEACPVEGCAIRVLKSRVNAHLRNVHNTSASQLRKCASKSEECEGDSRRFVCVECGRKFGKGAHLTAHIQAVHEGKKDVRPKIFKCDVPQCNRQFALRAQFEAHKNWHQGLKPFVCPFDQCNKRFTSRGSLNKHLNTNHMTGFKDLKEALKLAIGVAHVDVNPAAASTSTNNL